MCVQLLITLTNTVTFPFTLVSNRPKLFQSATGSHNPWKGVGVSPKQLDKVSEE